MKIVISMMTTVVCLFLLAAAAQAADINLAVAVSLKEVVNELSDSFAKKHPGVRFLKNYGGSGQLAKQIESGAPADIFISANLEWMDYLKGKQLVDRASVGTFAYNQLVFAGTPGKAVSLKDLVRLQRIAVGSPKSVPAGAYALEALEKAGLAKQLTKKLVMAKDVRECLVYAERGEADGAFVYKTDALQARKSKVLFSIPQELYPRVTYPAALTNSGARNRDAAAFFSYLKSGEAKAVLARYGFTTH